MRTDFKKTLINKIASFGLGAGLMMTPNLDATTHLKILDNNNKVVTKINYSNKKGADKLFEIFPKFKNLSGNFFIKDPLKSKNEFKLKTNPKTSGKLFQEDGKRVNNAFLYEFNKYPGSKRDIGIKVVLDEKSTNVLNGVGIKRNNSDLTNKITNKKVQKNNNIIDISRIPKIENINFNNNEVSYGVDKKLSSKNKSFILPLNQGKYPTLFTLNNNGLEGTIEDIVGIDYNGKPIFDKYSKIPMNKDGVVVTYLTNILNATNNNKLTNELYSNYLTEVVFKNKNIGSGENLLKNYNFNRISGLKSCLNKSGECGTLTDKELIKSAYSMAQLKDITNYILKRSKGGDFSTGNIYKLEEKSTLTNILNSGLKYIIPLNLVNMELTLDTGYVGNSNLKEGWKYVQENCSKLKKDKTKMFWCSYDIADKITNRILNGGKN